MCIFTYGLSSSRSTFFFAIFLLFPRGRDFRFSSLLAFFPLDGFGSSTQQKGFVVARQQNRIGRLSPFLLSRFSLLDEQKSASSESRRKVVEFVATSRSIIMVDEQRTTDNDRENAEGDDDGATAPVPEKVTTLLLLKHRHRFYIAFDDKTTKNKANNRALCVFVVHRPKSRFERVPSRGMPFEI